MRFCSFIGQKWTPARDPALREIEEWAGHRKTRNHMKILFFILLTLILAFFVLGLTGCVTTTETKYHADGSKSVIERKEADRAVLVFGSEVIRAYSTREIERSGK